MFDSSRYETRQKVLISNKYAVHEGDDPIPSAKQKKFKLKEGFRLNGHDIDEKCFRIKADSVFGVSAVYDTVDSWIDEHIGAVKYGASSFAKHIYQLLGPDDSIAGRIAEDSILMAIAKRLITTSIPFSRRVEDAAGEEVGAVDGRFSPRDKYTIDMDHERIDPRLAVVGAVMIDAIGEN